MKFIAAIALFLNFHAYANDIETPEFDIDPEISTNSGYQRIDWGENTKGLGLTYQLQQSRDKDFESAEVLYEGKDRATFVSGLPNGTYYYRVRAIQGEQTSAWSDILTLEVKHHNLSWALSLAGIGLVVFFLTVYVIIHGVRQQEKQNKLDG